MTLHFLNDVATDTKIENYVIIASLESETMGKLINRIPGLRLLISSLPGKALRTQASRCQQAFATFHKLIQLFFFLLIYIMWCTAIKHFQN